MQHATASRTARVTLVAGALSALTLAGHTAGSGTLDGLGTSIVLLLSIGLALAAASPRRHRLRWAPVLGVLLAGQALLHLVLTFTSAHAHGGMATTIDPGAMVAGHVIAAVLAATLIVLADQLIVAWNAFLRAVIGERAWILVEPSGRTAQRLVLEDSSPLSDESPLRHDVIRRGPPVATVVSC